MNDGFTSRKLSRRQLLKMTGMAGAGIALAACAAPAAPAAPKPGTATESKPTEVPAAAGKTKLRLVVMDYDEKMKADTTALIDAYNKSQTAAEASLDVYSWGQGHDLLVTQISGGQAPDMCNVSAQWLGEWAGINEVLPLDLPADFLGNFVPSGIKAFTGTDGKLMGLPYFLDPRAMFYRKDLIKTAPATFDDVITSAKAVHKSPDMTGFGLTFAAKSDSLDYWWYAWFGVVGADGRQSIYDEKGKSRLASDEAIAATTFLTDLAQTHKVTNTDYSTAGRDEELQPLFYAGKLAMLETGSWFPTLLKKNAPTLDVGIASFPTAKAGMKAGTGFWPDAMIAFKQTKHVPEVTSALQWMYSKENRLAFAKQRGVIPERTDVGADPAYAVGDTEKFFVESLKTAYNVYETPYPATFNKVQAEVETLIGRAVAGELKPADAMKQAAEFMDKTNGVA